METKFSFNNKLVTELYIKEGLKTTIQGGIATPGQRDGVKGLRVLMDAKLDDGRFVPKGSLVYVKEEVLHNHSNTIFKPLSCSTISGKFMIVDVIYVEFVEIPDNAA